MPVNDINVDLEEGEIVGIVGESGSGKSLTALAIAQLVPHPGVLTAQHVRLRGEDITTMPAGELRYFLGSEMAMIFQDPMSSLNPALKIGTQLTEATRVHRGSQRASEFAQAGAGTDGGCAYLGCENTPETVSSRVFRRHAPARHDRDGLDDFTQPDHRGRTHHRS